MEYKHGATPTMYFYDLNGQELSNTVLSPLKTTEINALLESNGFTLPAEPEVAVVDVHAEL